jgi:hypothetical protein
MKKFITVLVAVGVALSVGQVAAGRTDAGRSNYKRAYQFHGTVSSVTADDDATTADSVVVSVTKANGNGKAFAGTDVTFTVDHARFYGAASSLADLAPGDAVKVKARNSETGFVAQTVKEKSASDDDAE